MWKKSNTEENYLLGVGVALFSEFLSKVANFDACPSLQGK